MYFRNSLVKCVKSVTHRLVTRNYSTNPSVIRNIGILAHIDAGKTTTTERMLYYSGITRSLGEVHHGNTITDCLTQERERGITICSSAVSFNWNEYTPGHIDFTMEVEQSLSAVDGVVIVLDGSAGVEAQTVTVWSQSERHNLPKMIFVNKMDRPDSDYNDCIKDIKAKFDVQPLSLQYPVKDSSGALSIIDIVNMKKIVWESKSLGEHYEQIPLEGNIKIKIAEQRNCLIDQLSGIDDELAELVIASESFDQVSNDLILKAIKRATCQHKVVPVLLGSAYKNIGIQPLLDSVGNFLPAPHDRNNIYDCFGSDFAGKVFKIIHDKQKGPLTLVRVLRGSMKKGMRLVATNGTSEALQKIYEPLADEYREISGVGEGDVAVCSGLKNTVTGDLLTSSASSINQAKGRLVKMLGKTLSEDGEEADKIVNDVLALEQHIPDAVYFCSIEPPSLSYQNALETALKQLQREDPSLRVTYDETTGQTVLGGMGELHMDVIKSRLLTEYKIDADLGPLQIAYKETIDTDFQDTWKVEKEIAGSKQSVSITLGVMQNQKEMFRLDNSPENAPILKVIRPRTLQVIKKGALAALERGPRMGGQVINTQIKLYNVNIGRGTADSFVMAAAGQCVQKLLTAVGTRLLEPLMSIQIFVPSEKVSAVLGDLSRRRAIINDVLPKSERNKMIDVHAPLAELTGYSSILRTISSGTASMTMQPCGYASMNAQDELVAIRRAQGLE